MVKRILLLAGALAGFLPAATQGPDAGGYSATDSAVFSFVDISGGGAASVLAGIDDGAVVIALPFSFQFYGTAYTQICVSSNGAAYFITDAAVCPGINDFANADLAVAGPPVDLPALLPLWSDLTFEVPGAGAVFYQTLGAVGARRFILQWNNAFPQGSPNPVTFEAILSEGSNAIGFQYRTAALGAGNPASNGAQATIGIRNTAGQTNGRQLPWSFEAPVVTDSSALAFTLGSGPLPPALTAPGNGAASVATPVTLSWSASPGATSYDVYFGTANPPPFLTNTSGTSNAPAGLSAGTTYNWQVVAKNAAGSGSSAILSFTTAAAS